MQKNMFKMKMGGRLIIFCSLLYFQGVISDAQPQHESSHGKPFNHKEIPKDNILRPTFSDWENWKTNFPQCDPTTNPYTSPINIIPSKATDDSGMKPIIVHSGSPAEECLFLSTIHKEDGLEMEVVNIFPDPACGEQITFISGAGEGPKDLRYFRRALIFLGNASSPQPLHLFDGKSFAMEIAMEFVSPNEEEVTGIHLMVKAYPEGEVPVNPAFKSIEDALIDLQSELADEASGTTETKEELKELKDACDKAEERYLEALEEHERLEANGTKFHVRLHKLEGIMSSIRNFRDANLTNLISEVDEIKSTTMEKKLDNLLLERDKIMQLINEGKDKIEELKEVMQKVRQLKQGIKDPKELELEEMLKLLAHNKVGIPGDTNSTNKSSEILFDSPDAVYKERRRILRVLKRQSVIEELYEKACKAYLDYKAVTRYAFVPIEDPFQISWLIPSNSGYYYYKGSNPIPPCERTSHSIVFDTPVKITTEQLKLFLELQQSTQNKSLSGNSTARTGNGSTTPPCKIMPRMLSLSDSIQQREIRHVKKSPVFLKDDGFHVKRSRKGKARAMKRGGRTRMAYAKTTDDNITSGSIGINQQKVYTNTKGVSFSFVLCMAWTWISIN